MPSALGFRAGNFLYVGSWPLLSTLKRAIISAEEGGETLPPSWCDVEA